MYFAFDFIIHFFLVSDGSAAPSIISHNSEELLRETKEKGISMAYICKLQPRPGALLLDKCVQHGVPPGPLLGKLKAGEDITLESGVTVRSSDVCEPNDPGPVFIGNFFESGLESNSKLRFFSNRLS